MTGAALPGGGKAWFVRRKKRRGCSLRPVSMEGRLLTAGYAAFVSAVTWLLVDPEFRPVMLIAWITLLAAATFLFILTALRMSAPATQACDGKQ